MGTHTLRILKYLMTNSQIHPCNIKGNTSSASFGKLFPYLLKNGRVSWDRRRLVATQNILAINAEHLLPLAGLWTLLSGILLVTVVVARGLAWVSFWMLLVTLARSPLVGSTAATVQGPTRDAFSRFGFQCALGGNLKHLCC